MYNIDDYLKKFVFWDKLTDDEKVLIKMGASFQKYEKGQLIHSCCNNCLGMIMMVNGEARTSLLSEEGREVTIFRVYPGDTCVLSASCVINQITFESHMTADADCDLLVINAGIVSKLMESNINVRCFVYETATSRFSDAMWVMQQILFMKFDRRLASFLIGEMERTGSNEIKMTHEMIANYTGSAREVVARMLKHFVEDGYVQLKRGMIRITDPESLRDLL